MKLILILFSLIISFASLAQKEANHWYFGEYSGLDFSKGSPVVTPGSAMIAVEGSAVISDPKTGELLFYTNGEQVWNKNHRLMPHGRDISINLARVTQSALIIPIPEKQQYYLFTLQTHNTYGDDPRVIDISCELHYSIVDMQLDSTLGDIVADSKNTFLLANLTEKLTAVPHSNGKDYWLITHGWNSNTFNANLVSALGISSKVTSPSGSVHQTIDTTINAIYQTSGYLKASPNGKKLACAVQAYSPRPFELFDFDAGTGTVFNAVDLGNIQGQYGISFSSDNTKLYLSTLSNNDIIIQYDLQDGNPEAIKKSREGYY